jgi:hypothetical protein
MGLLWSEEINRVVALVNNQVITYKDLNDYCKLFSYQLSQKETVDCNDEDSKREALERLIEDRLILDKAKKEKIGIPLGLIENKLKEIISSYPSSEEFEKSLIDKGLNITLLKEKIKEQYLVRSVIEKYVDVYIKVLPQEINKYYALHIKDFYSDPRYTLWIMKSEDKKFLKEICNAIKTKSFEEIKREYSKDLIRMESEPKDLKEEIVNCLEELKEGDCLIRNIEEEVYLIYLEKKEDSHLLSLEEVKEKIYSYLWRKKFKERFKEWLGELKREAAIKVYFP